MFFHTGCSLTFSPTETGEGEASSTEGEEGRGEAREEGEEAREQTALPSLQEREDIYQKEVTPETMKPEA